MPKLAMLNLLSVATDALQFLPPHTLNAMVAAINGACASIDEPLLKITDSEREALTAAVLRRTRAHADDGDGHAWN